MFLNRVLLKKILGIFPVFSSRFLTLKYTNYSTPKGDIIMAITQSQLMQIIKEEISRAVNERKYTDAEIKEMRAKAEELKTKYNKLEELALDIDHDIEAVRIQMKKAESDKEKAAFRSKITALTNKKKGVTNASDKAWDDFEAIKLELGKKYNR